MAFEICPYRLVCAVSSSWCVSKPPIEQKKTCRLTLRDVWFSLMIFATCLSWLPRPEFGKTAVTVGSTPSAAWISSACCVMSLVALTSGTPVSKVRSELKADLRALSIVFAANPLRGKIWLRGVGAGAALRGFVTWPTLNWLFPASEQTGGKTVPVFSEATASAVRPPQPVVVFRSERGAIHEDCWSLWEKSW